MTQLQVTSSIGDPDSSGNVAEAEALVEIPDSVLVSVGTSPQITAVPK